MDTALYSIVWLRKATKQLKAIDKKLAIIIIKKVSLLTSDKTEMLDTKKIKGLEHFFRIRIGDYRVIYQINQNKKEYVICKIGHRKDIYQSLSGLPLA